MSVNNVLLRQTAGAFATYIRAITLRTKYTGPKVKVHQCGSTPGRLAVVSQGGGNGTSLTALVRAAEVEARTAKLQFVSLSVAPVEGNDLQVHVEVVMGDK